jgi:MOSC domain-containing protein YiiM
LRPLPPEGQASGIFKLPVPSVQVTAAGMTGDHQADRRHHGGPDKAIHQFAVASYATIVSAYPQLKGIAMPGSIGENLTAGTMTDTSVCIGDCYRIGTTTLQVSQPRSPCWKIDHRFGIERLSVFLENRGITGWYYRVVETGKIDVGDAVELLDRPNAEVTVTRFLQVLAQHRPDPAALEQLISCRGLAQEWVARLRNRRDYVHNAAQS